MKRYKQPVAGYVGWNDVSDTVVDFYTEDGQIHRYDRETDTITVL